MKILMIIVLALSMCICTQVDTVRASVEPACVEYTEVYWYPGQYVRPAILGLARGGAKILGGAARGGARILGGVARGTGRVLRGAARAVSPNVFEVTVVTTDETVIFYAIAGSERGLRIRLRVNRRSGNLLYRTPDGLRRIPSDSIQSVEIKQLN